MRPELRIVANYLPIEAACTDSQNSTRMNSFSSMACWKLSLVSTSTPSSSSISTAQQRPATSDNRTITERILNKFHDLTGMERALYTIE